MLDLASCTSMKMCSAFTVSVHKPIALLLRLNIILTYIRSYGVLSRGMGNSITKCWRQRRISSAEVNTPVRVPSSDGIKVKHSDELGRVTPTAEEPDPSSTIEPRVMF